MPMTSRKVTCQQPDPRPPPTHTPRDCTRRPPWRRLDGLARLLGWHCFNCWRHDRQPHDRQPEIGATCHPERGGLGQ